MKLFKVDKLSRLTEEILEETQFGDENINKISLNKVCENQTKDPDFFLKSTSVCWHCYYDKLGLVMKEEIKKSRRKDFLIHQMNLRKHPNQFLEELRRIIIDNENYLNEYEYSTSNDFLNIIDDLINNLKSNLSEKTAFIIQYLYDRRETGSNYDLEKMLKEKGYRTSKVEVHNLCEILKNENLAKISSHSDGASARINANGILTVENDELRTTKETEQEDHFADLIDHIDLKFADLMVEVNLNASELADMVEELREEFKSYSKPAITRLVRMKMAEYFMSETIKTGIVRPALKEIAETIILNS